MGVHEQQGKTKNMGVHGQSDRTWVSSNEGVRIWVSMNGGEGGVQDSAAVGVFDSGMGGLSVLREIRRLLPAESLRYVADAAYVPYGQRRPEEILERSRLLFAFFRQQGVKAMVVACNTATAAAVPALRAQWPDFPIIAMEPAVKPAVAATRNGIVGVLATEGTLSSGRFAALLSQYAGRVRVITQPCPGLVEAVEHGDLEAPELVVLVRRYLTPLLEAGADTLILGCTHYPFLRNHIARLAGPDVRLIDTGAAVARELQRRLTDAGALAHVRNHALNAPLAETLNAGGHRFWTTGNRDDMQRFLDNHWPEKGCVATSLGTDCEI
jgi:glutamate racemase